MLTADQWLAIQKANLETLTGLTNKAFESLEKLVDLNLKTTRAALDVTTDRTQGLLNARDAQELIALQTRLMEPLAQKAAEYNQQLLDIAQTTHEALSQAMQTQGHHARQQWADLIDDAGLPSPTGLETQMTVMKNALSTANEAYETVQKALKQAAELTHIHMKH